MAQLLETNGTSIRTSNNNIDYVKLYNQSENELINEVMPFWLNFGIDEQYGGFICGLKHNGDIDDDSKYAWYQGRGAWIMCKYYEGYKQDPKYLDIARNSLLFTLKHCCNWEETKVIEKEKCITAYIDGDDTSSDLKNLKLKHCLTIVNRNGSIMDGRTEVDKVGYAMCFLAEGLIAYSTLCNKHEAGKVNNENGNKIVKLAIQLIKYFYKMANDPNRDAPESYLLNTPYVKGTRTLGHSMIPLRFCTQLLRNNDGLLSEEDRTYATKLANECVTNILDRHYDKKWNLVREEMNHDWSQLNNNSNSPVLFYLGHAIESFWMVMDEALRVNDEKLFHKASLYLKRHCECCYDELTGGLVRGISIGDDHNDKCLKDKVAWVQQEALVGTLMAIRYSKNQAIIDWATNYFNKLYKWTYQYFPLKNYGEQNYSLWMVGSDRRVEFKETYSYGNAGLKSRKENYHHPRMLMLFMKFCKAKISSTIHDE